MSSDFLCASAHSCSKSIQNCWNRRKQRERRRKVSKPAVLYFLLFICIVCSKIEKLDALAYAAGFHFLLFISFVAMATNYHTNVGSTLMADWLEPGTKAPDFTLATDDGTKLKLSELRGSPVVLYFYPKDDTPGCTKEACAFRDASKELTKLGAKVLGVSPDDVKSHGKFRDKFKLNFPLLADLDHKIAEKYGAWREKNMYGKKTMGIARSTYIIDKEGKIARVWKAVKVDGHDVAVLAALKELG